MNFADPTQILRSLEVLVEPGSVTELRALSTSKRTMSGYYNNLETMAQHAATITDAEGVYLTLNPVNPDLLARSANHVTPWAKHTTADNDILRRRWLPIDFDPRRPAGISSTDAEHELALDRAQQCNLWLSDRGWPEPVLASSGNGGHLLYRIDLPNDAHSTDLIKRILNVIADRFSDDQVEVDRNVFNPARIWKLYGTYAQKGDSLTDRPHRLSRLLANGGAIQ
jgi:hypothetical protein